MIFNHNCITGRAKIIGVPKEVGIMYEVNCKIYGYAGDNNLIMTFPIAKSKLYETLPEQVQFMFIGHLTETDLGYPAIKLNEIIAVETDIENEKGDLIRGFNTKKGVKPLEEINTMLELTIVPLGSKVLVTKNVLKSPLCKVEFDPMPYSHPTGKVTLICKQKLYNERMKPYENHEYVNVNLRCNLMVDQYAKSNGYQDKISFIVYTVESF